MAKLLTNVNISFTGVFRNHVWVGGWKGFEDIAVPEAFHLWKQQEEQCIVGLPNLICDQHQHLKQVAFGTFKFSGQQNPQFRIRFAQTEELFQQAIVPHPKDKTVHRCAKSEYGQYLGAPEVQGDEIKAVQDEKKGLHTWAS